MYVYQKENPDTRHSPFQVTAILQNLPQDLGWKAALVSIPHGDFPRLV